MTEAEIEKVRKELLEIFSELSLENQQNLLMYARKAQADENQMKNSTKST